MYIQNKECENIERESRVDFIFLPLHVATNLSIGGKKWRFKFSGENLTYIYT